MQPLTVADARAVLAEASVSELPGLIAELRKDGRAGVVSAVQAVERRLARELAEIARLERLAERERALIDVGIVVAGVDEVGVGALAGPVSAGACVFPRDAMLPGLNDSKKLSPVARERLAGEIRSTAIAVAVAHAGPDEIDAIGIAGATVLAMRRAVALLGVEVSHILVDGGRRVDLGVPSTHIVKGDSSVRAIAAAAIVAKVTRDALMRELDTEHPGYGFAGNKGYGSADHLVAIASLGPSPVHRRSFAPCSQLDLF